MEDENKRAEETSKPEPPPETSENVTIRLDGVDAIEQRKQCLACYWKGRADGLGDTLSLVVVLFAMLTWLVWRATK